MLINTEVRYVSFHSITYTVTCYIRG